MRCVISLLASSQHGRKPLVLFIYLSRAQTTIFVWRADFFFFFLLLSLFIFVQRLSCSSQSVCILPDLEIAIHKRGPVMKKLLNKRHKKKGKQSEHLTRWVLCCFRFVWNDVKTNQRSPLTSLSNILRSIMAGACLVRAPGRLSGEVVQMVKRPRKHAGCRRRRWRWWQRQTKRRKVK